MYLRSCTPFYICDRISWEEWNVHLVRLWLQEPDTRADSRKLGQNKKKRPVFRVTRPYLNLLVKPRNFFQVFWKIYDFMLLKGKMPFKMHKIIYFFQKKELKIKYVCLHYPKCSDLLPFFIWPYSSFMKPFLTCWVFKKFCCVAPAGSSSSSCCCGFRVGIRYIIQCHHNLDTMCEVRSANHCYIVKRKFNLLNMT